MIPEMHDLYLRQLAVVRQMSTDERLTLYRILPIPKDHAINAITDSLQKILLNEGLGI